MDQQDKSAPRFSKGPWTVDETYVDVDGAILGADGFPVCSTEQTAILPGYDQKLGVRHWSDHEGEAFITRRPEEVQANARLIAAAPDLYEALRAYVDYTEAGVECGEAAETEVDLMLHARAALAKATGSQQ